MIAPRKTLWSTPDEVITELVEWIHLEAGDTVIDIGCGDGRVIIEWATYISSKNIHGRVKFMGVEIDHDRAMTAKGNVSRAFRKGLIDDSKISIEVHCCNALEAPELCREATVVFLYLIPRGLRIVTPLLMEASKSRPVKVVTYMSPLPGISHTEKRTCSVAHQPGSAWPLFLYDLDQKAQLNVPQIHPPAH